MNLDALPENDPFRNVWVYDIEVFPNCFCMTAVNMVNPKNIKRFVIWKQYNDAKKLVEFVKSCYGMIGYNNIGFDYPIIHVCLITRPTAAQMQKGSDLAEFIYRKTQEFMSREYPPFVNHVCKQRDVYRIWHFDNDAKATSLKWVECAIRWPSVEDMPYDFHTPIENQEMMDKVLSYNLNDCLATRQFYLDKTIPKVKLRKVLSAKFGIKIDNANDAKIGEEIILSGIAKRRGIPLFQLKEEAKAAATRTHVHLKDVILPHIEFKTKQFQNVLSKLRGITVRVGETRKGKKDEIKVIFDEMVYKFGYGGIHAARKNVVHKDVWSCDVSSYYPNLAIGWGFYPAHLNPEYGIIYPQMYEERKKYPKGSPENEGLKLALNASFGKSNSMYSALNDIKAFMQITINGQLLLAMLCEEITLSGAGTVIMANTDGVEVIVKNDKLYHEICEAWQKKNRVSLEFVKYSVIAIRDVNNYTAISESGKIKEKGAYKIDKEVNEDHSMKVVALAIREFLTKGTPVDEFIKKHEDIWDFFMYVRAKTGEFRFYDLDPETSEPINMAAPKTIRYYISKKGSVLLKKTEKKLDRVHKGVYILPANNVESMNFLAMPEMLDRDFYVKEAMKLLNGVYTTQQTLF